MMDAGFFMNSQDVLGVDSFQKSVQSMVSLHNMIGGFHPVCYMSMPKDQLYKCFFPQYNLMYVNRPVFIVNSIADYAAIFILNESTNQTSSVVQCLYSSSSCPPGENANLQTYQKTVTRTVSQIMKSKPSFGYYLTAEVQHCATIYDTWIFQSQKVLKKEHQLVPDLSTWFWS
jgi:hypothetical protein